MTLIIELHNISLNSHLTLSISQFVPFNGVILDIGVNTTDITCFMFIYQWT